MLLGQMSLIASALVEPSNKLLVGYCGSVMVYYHEYCGTAPYTSSSC
jgi:hypothetical protein